jgi:membrane protein YqaA with SNARE-associated domain
VTDDLLARFGIYGGSIVIAFIAGMFPLMSIELFLISISAALLLSLVEILACCGLAAVSHQVAKTITYFAGVGALEHGRIGRKIEKARPRIEKWNKAPKLVLLLGAVFGLPPLYLLGFIAEPLMRIRFVPYTAITFSGRLVRFVFLAAIPLVFSGSS